MAYDEQLATRIRSSLGADAALSERRMFGGLAFMLNGNMCCGVLGSELMLRLGNEGAEVALAQPHVRPMDFTGKPIRSMVYVSAAGISSDDDLREWVERAADFARSLPGK